MCVPAQIEGRNVDVIFLDFAKAFDKVRHQRLLEKLRSHGIRGNFAEVDVQNVITSCILSVNNFHH